MPQISPLSWVLFPALLFLVVLVVCVGSWWSAKSVVALGEAGSRVGSTTSSFYWSW